MGNYYSELKKIPTYVSGWPGGWEVPVEDGKPCFYPEVKGAARKDVRRQLAMRARIARACKDKNQYDELRARIDESDWEFIEKNNLKGAGLRDWAFNTYTNSEFDRLLRYN